MHLIAAKQSREERRGEQSRTPPHDGYGNELSKQEQHDVSSPWFCLIVRTCTHRYVCEYRHTQTHTHILAQPYLLIHTHTHRHAHTHKTMRKGVYTTHIYTLSPVYMHRLGCKFAQTHKHVYIYTHTCTEVHTSLSRAISEKRKKPEKAVQFTVNNFFASSFKEMHKKMQHSTKEEDRNSF